MTFATPFAPAGGAGAAYPWERSAEYPWERPLGSRPRADGTVEFRVWAPHAQSISLRLGDRDLPLEDAGYGVYETVAPAGAGDDYWFVLDGRQFPDPCSRWQPDGIRGPSRVLELRDPGAVHGAVRARPRDLRATRGDIHAGGDIRGGNPATCASSPTSA